MEGKVQGGNRVTGWEKEETSDWSSKVKYSWKWYVNL